MPPENKKKTISRVHFRFKNNLIKVFFRKFWFFVFLRNKVWNQPIISHNKKTVKLSIFLKIHDRTHDILVDYLKKISLSTQNLKNANYQNTLKKFPCEWLSLFDPFFDTFKYLVFRFWSGKLNAFIWS